MQKLIRDIYIVYIPISNSYIVLDHNTHTYFKAYKTAKTKVAYLTLLGTTSNSELNILFYDTFFELENTIPIKKSKPLDIVFSKSAPLVKYLTYQNLVCQVASNNMDTLQDASFSYQHLETDIQNSSHTLTIQENASTMALKNTSGQVWSWSLHEKHVFQGKFSFELLNAIHQKTEQDWIGTLHASTIGNGEEGIMLVGNSGSGKSTLATLLMLHGFDLIADDMSAMLLENNHIAVLPAAISVKEKAFNTIAPLVPDFQSLPSQYINTKKGYVTYVPPLPLKNPNCLSYPCKNLVLVRYSQTPIATQLKQGAEKTILEELISESWLAHNEVHAKAFLDWLGTVNFYELKYHNNQEAIAAVSSLF